MKRILTLMMIAVFLLSFAQFKGSFALDIERPGGSLNLSQRVENASTDSNAAVGLGVDVGSYRENCPDWPGNGSGKEDIVTLRIAATANTRKIIQYWGGDLGYYSWIDDTYLQSLNLGDEQIVDIPMVPSKVRFYGGPGSAEYTDIWVSSNGWLSFVDLLHYSPPSPTPYYGYTIPNTAGPNCFVAPLWKDLKPNLSGSIRISYGWTAWWPGFGQTRTVFVVTWNATDKYGQPQVFQAILEMCPPYNFGQHAWCNSVVWFQYKYVTTADPATVGVEDQGGWRGSSYDYHNLSNHKTLQFDDGFYDYAGISYLVIRLSSDANAYTKTEQTPGSARGQNIVLDQSLPPEDPSEKYKLALSGSGTFLLAALEVGTPWTWVTGVGLLFDTAMLGWDLCDYAAREQAAAKLLTWSDNCCIASGLEPNYNALPVDADLCITAYWVLSDANTVNHTLNVSAELWYDQFDYSGLPISRTVMTTAVQVKLTIDNNNDFGGATQLLSNDYRSGLYVGGYDPCDFYRVPADPGYVISVSAWIRSPDPLIFALFLYNRTYTQRSYTSYGSSVSLSFTADVSGPWFVKVVPQGTTYGYYSLSVYVYYPSGGGGCPTLYVYNGSKYDCEGLLDIHNPAGTDVTCDHTLTTKPAFVDGTYRMRLIEHPQTISHIDQVKLYATLQDGKTISLPLVWAWHSEYGNVLPQLLFNDEYKTETKGADHNNGISQSIDLRFLALPPQIKVSKFTFEIEGNNIIRKM